MPASRVIHRFPGKLVPVRVQVIAGIGAAGWSVAHGADFSGHNGDVTRFLLAFSVILFAAKVGGEGFDRLNQPAVLGELLVGILLGNMGPAGFGFAETLRAAPFLGIAA